MTVKERIERRAEFKSEKFVVYDPDVGRMIAYVREFIGLKNDGTTGVRDDHPAMKLEVIKEEC